MLLLSSNNLSKMSISYARYSIVSSIEYFVVLELFFIPRWKLDFDFTLIDLTFDSRTFKRTLRFLSLQIFPPFFGENHNNFSSIDSNQQDDINRNSSEISSIWIFSTMQFFKMSLESHWFNNFGPFLKPRWITYFLA